MMLQYYYTQKDKVLPAPYQLQSDTPCVTPNQGDRQPTTAAKAAGV
jgi:hypothetical protein